MSNCPPTLTLYSSRLLLLLPRETRPQTRARCALLYSHPQTWSRLDSIVTVHGRARVRSHTVFVLVLALVLVPVPVSVPVPGLVPVSVSVHVPVPTPVTATGLTTWKRPTYPDEDADSAQTPWIFFLHLAALGCGSVSIE